MARLRLLPLLLVCLSFGLGCRLYEPPRSSLLDRAMSVTPTSILDDPHYLDESHMALRLSEPLSLPTGGDPSYFAGRLARSLGDATSRCERTIEQHEGVVEMRVELGCREASGHLRATFKGEGADRRVDLEFDDFWMNGHRLDGTWSLTATPAAIDPESGRSTGYVVAATDPAPYKELPPQALPQRSTTRVVAGRGVLGALVADLFWLVISSVAVGLEAVGDR